MDVRAGTTIQTDGDDLVIFGQLVCFFSDLIDELSRRCEDENLDSLFGHVDLLEDGDEKRSSLACPGLGLSDEVFASKDRCDDLSLDVGSSLIFHVC